MLKAKIPKEEVAEKLATLIHSENEAIALKACTEYMDRVFGKSQQTIDMSAKVEEKTEQNEIAEHLGNMSREEKLKFFDLWEKSENA